MRRLVLALLSTLALPAAAQPRVVTFDSLGGETPSAVTCGFCAGEKFGVVFRDLPPPSRGLDADEFPIELRTVRVAVASARVMAGACSGTTEGGVGLATLAVYAGETAPSGDISALPEDGPWPGETEVIVAEDLPLTRSSADVEGGSMFEVAFNELRLVDEGEPPVIVDRPNAYLRVVFTLQEEIGDRSSSCTSAGLPSPGMFPLRDNDGRIADERSFIFAGGLGWLWNEDSRIRLGGDWGVRVEVVPMGSPDEDAGPPAMDAGTDAGAEEEDAGPAEEDAGRDAAAADAGREPMGDDGCGCRSGGDPSGAILLALVIPLLARRRHRR